MEDRSARDLIDALIDHAGTTLWRASRAMGRPGQYLDTQRRRGSVLRVDTLARLADVCGADVVLVDRASGEGIARVRPPERDGAPSSGSPSSASGPSGDAGREG